MEINELKDYPPVDDSWSDDKKEEYHRLVNVHKGLDRLIKLAEMLMSDSETEARKQEYLKLKSQGKI